MLLIKSCPQATGTGSQSVSARVVIVVRPARYCGGALLVVSLGGGGGGGACEDKGNFSLCGFPVGYSVCVGFSLANYVAACPRLSRTDLPVVPRGSVPLISSLI